MGGGEGWEVGKGASHLGCSCHSLRERAQEEMQFRGEAIGEGKLGFGLEVPSFRAARTCR